MNHSYEDMAVAHAAPEGLPVMEAMSPVAVGRWFDTMGFRLQKLVRKYRQSNPEYADILTKYWSMWMTKGQEIKDMSPEGFEYLSGAAEAPAAMDWPEASFFQGLIMTLNSASQDIRSSAMGAGNAEQNEPFTGGAGMSAPPMGTDFGPEEEAPPGAEEPPPEGEEGAAPAPGVPGEETEPETPTAV